MAKQPERYVLKQGYFPEQPPQEPPVVLDPEYARSHRKNTKPLLIKIVVAVLALGLIAAGIVFVPRLMPAAAPSWSAADIAGQWSYNVDGSAMVATVTQTTIEIRWATADANALYWKGTFPVPAGAESEKTVISIASPENATALMASSDPQKTFTVRRDAIIYDVTAMGVTRRVTLTKGR